MELLILCCLVVGGREGEGRKFVISVESNIFKHNVKTTKISEGYHHGASVRLASLPLVGMKMLVTLVGGVLTRRGKMTFR